MTKMIFMRLVGGVILTVAAIAVGRPALAAVSQEEMTANNDGTCEDRFEEYFRIAMTLRPSEQPADYDFFDSAREVYQSCPDDQATRTKIEKFICRTGMYDCEENIRRVAGTSEESEAREAELARSNERIRQDNLRDSNEFDRIIEEARPAYEARDRETQRRLDAMQPGNCSHGPNSAC